MRSDPKLDELFATAFAAHEKVLRARAAVEHARQTARPSAVRQFEAVLRPLEETLSNAKQAIVDHCRTGGGPIRTIR